MLNIFGEERGISFPIQTLVSILLPLLFLWVCYRFDLFPNGRKKKKNRIDELHDELEDFYLEEKAKLKEKESSLD